MRKTKNTPDSSPSCRHTPAEDGGPSGNLLESRVEKYFKAQAKKRGYICWKFVSPSQDGVPDRVVIGHGITAFVELKRPGEKPRPLQEYILKLLKDHGAVTGVVDSEKSADAFFENLKSR